MPLRQGSVWGTSAAGRREHGVRFWEAIARGASSEKAAIEAGVLPSIGVRWFRKGGGMPPLTLAPVSGRYLSFAEREEIAVGLAGGCGVREIARRLGRAPSTISRELQRNAAIGRGRVSIEPRLPRGMPSVALDDPSRRSSRSTPELRAYVQDRLSGAVQRPDGSVAGLMSLARAASGTAKGPPLGAVLESGADLQSAPR